MAILHIDTLLGLCETNDWESCHLDIILKVEALESDCLQPDVPEPRASAGPAELVTLHQMLGQECCTACHRGHDYVFE